MSRDTIDPQIGKREKASVVRELSSVSEVTSSTNGVIYFADTGKLASYKDGVEVGAIDGGLNSVVYKPSLVNQWQTAYAGYTWRSLYEVPVNVKAVKLGFASATNGTWTVDGIAVCSAKTFASFDNPTESPFIVGTFDNGKALTKSIDTLVPTQFAAANCPNGIIWSDWVPCSTIDRTDGGTYPLVLVSVYSASTNTVTNTAGGALSAWANAAYLKRKQAFKTGNNLTATGFGSGDPSTMPLLAMQFLVDDSVSAKTLAVFGDSIAQGNKTTIVGQGYVNEASRLLKAAGKNVLYVNSGFPGNKAQDAYYRAVTEISSGLVPNVAVYAPYSRNSGLSYTPAESTSYCAAFIELCRKYNVTPVISSSIYETSNTAYNPVADAVDVTNKEYCLKTNTVFVDFRQVINSATAVALLDADGIHPNNTGNLALAEYLYSIIGSYF